MDDHGCTLTMRLLSSEVLIILAFVPFQDQILSALFQRKNSEKS